MKNGNGLSAKVLRLIKLHYSETIIDSERLCSLLSLNANEWRGVRNRLLGTGMIACDDSNQLTYIGPKKEQEESEATIEATRLTALKTLQDHLALSGPLYDKFFTRLKSSDRNEVTSLRVAYNKLLEEEDPAKLPLKTLVTLDGYTKSMIQILGEAKRKHCAKEGGDMDSMVNKLIKEDLTIVEISNKIDELFDYLPEENKFRKCALTRAQVFAWVFSRSLDKHNSRSHVLNIASKLIRQETWGDSFRVERVSLEKKIFELNLQVTEKNREIAMKDREIAMKDKEIAILNHECAVKNKLLYDIGEPLEPSEKEKKVLN